MHRTWKCILDRQNHNGHYMAINEAFIKIKKKNNALWQRITSTQVAADRCALRIWRWVSLPEGGQKFLLQWQLADNAWLACGRVAATRSAAERPSNAPSQSHSLQRSHPHLNSIFASKLHARDPLHHVHWVMCIGLIRWHHSQTTPWAPSHPILHPRAGWLPLRPHSAVAWLAAGRLILF